MTSATPWWRRRLGRPTVRRLGVAVLVLAAAVVLVASLRLNAEDWHATGDRATIELRTRDVGTEHTPLLGQMTRYGFNNPGPLQYWALAVPYRLLGGRSSHAAAGVLAAAALAATVAVAGRTRSPGFVVWVALLSVALARSMGHDLPDPWNPWMPVPWFPVLFLATWRLSTGDVVMLPVSVGVASYLVHCHVQYALLVGCLGLWAVVLGGLAGRRRRRTADEAEAESLRRSVRGALLWTAVVVAVAWGPALVDQVTSDRPNLDRFQTYLSGERTEYLGSTSEQTYPPVRALQELAYVTRPHGRWLTGSKEFFANPSWRDVGWLGGTVAAGGALGFVLWRRREREALLLLCAAGIVLAGSYLSLVTIRGPGLFYLVRFLWPAAMCLWLALGWGVWRVLPAQLRAAVRTPTVLAVAAGGLALVIGLAAVILPLPPTDGDQKLLAAHEEEIFGAIPAGHHVGLVEFRGDPIFTTLSFDLELEKRGWDTAVSRVYLDGLGQFRVDREPDFVLTVVDGQVLDDWLARAAAGEDGLRLLVFEESDAGRRESEMASVVATELDACGIVGLDKVLRQRHYDDVLTGLGDACLAARLAAEEAKLAYWEARDGAYWARYGVFYQPR